MDYVDIGQVLEIVEDAIERSVGFGPTDGGGAVAELLRVRDDIIGLLPAPAQHEIAKLDWREAFARYTV